MTVYEFVRLVWGDPKIPEDMIESIVWGCTSYPSFWITDNHVKEFALQLRHAKRSLKRGFQIDDIFDGTDLKKKRV